MLGFLISRQADKPKWVPQLPAEKTIHARGPGVPQISTMISSIFGAFWNQFPAMEWFPFQSWFPIV